VANGDLIDKIDSLDEFYKEFGYTAEIAKTGILADEFIWDNYVKDRSLDACLQMHIVQYLIKHSLKFKELYVHCYEEYVKEHVDARIARGFECIACKHMTC
jgi:3-dehydroquinate synthetase